MWHHRDQHMKSAILSFEIHICDVPLAIFLIFSL